MELIKRQISDNKKRKFPRNIGIIFLIIEDNKKSFDPLPCAHLISQMNAIQNLLNFEFISLGYGKLANKNLPIPTMKNNGNLFKPFDMLICNVENAYNKWDIDYWLGVTTMSINKNAQIPRNSFYEVWNKEEAQESGKTLGMVT